MDRLPACGAIWRQSTGDSAMTSVGYIVLFLAGILGYAALLYRVMNRRTPTRHVASRAAMEHVTTHSRRPHG
jgi:hypothetical protein